jgi:hypothetical protein
MKQVLSFLISRFCPAGPEITEYRDLIAISRDFSSVVLIVIDFCKFLFCGVLDFNCFSVCARVKGTASKTVSITATARS